MWIQKVAGAGVDGLAYAPDGATLYTIDGLSRFAAWNVTTREAKSLTRLMPFERFGLSRLLTSPDGQFLVALQPDTSVAVPVADGEGWRHAHVGTPWPKEARFVPGGARLAMLDTRRRACEAWDIATNQFASRALPGWPATGQVWSFDFAPDGRTVAVLAETGEVTLADTASREVVARITIPQRSPYLAHIQFAPDGNTLLMFTGHQAVLWDIPRGAVRAETHVPDLFGSTFALNPALPVFAALNRERVLTLYSLDTGKPLRSLDFMLGRFVRCVCFAPDGLTCAIGGSNRQFAVFDMDI